MFPCRECGQWECQCKENRRRTMKRFSKYRPMSSYFWQIEAFPGEKVKIISYDGTATKWIDITETEFQEIKRILTKEV